MASNYQKLYYSDYEKAVAERDAAKTELARQAREISFLRGELKKAEQRTLSASRTLTARAIRCR